jgi:hypothetical protein
MFDDVPDGCVAHIVEQLHSIQDVFNFQRTCSRFAAVGRAHQAAWLSLLRRDFDLRLEVRLQVVMSLAIGNNVAEVISYKHEFVVTGNGTAGRARAVPAGQYGPNAQDEIPRLLHGRWCR